MKQLATIGLFFFFTIGCFSQNEFIEMDSKMKSDSLEVLARCDFFVPGFEPGDELAERVANLVFMINHGYKFDELEQLLHHKNVYINLYAFIAICQNHFEKLTDAHLKITKSGRPVILYDKNGNIKYKTVGFWSNEIYKGNKEERTQNAIYRPPLEVAIKSFILKYALYPQIYLPVSFDLFLNNETYLGIRHTYIIKNNAGITDTVKNFFVTNSKNEIQEIAEKVTYTEASYPPKINDWLTKYGRQLSKQDSIDVHLRH